MTRNAVEFNFEFGPAVGGVNVGLDGSVACFGVGFRRDDHVMEG